MVEPRYRTSSVKPRAKRTPGGKVVVHYEKKRVKAPKCARCGRRLEGMKILRPKVLKRVNKSKKKVNRPYGGYLCSSCMRQEIKAKVRKK
ncbi:50S ribosomal protein L34e [archaeon]|nr:50S ribosomal protein L34e [archaeon]